MNSAHRFLARYGAAMEHCTRSLITICVFIGYLSSLGCHVVGVKPPKRGGSDAEQSSSGGLPSGCGGDFGDGERASRFEVFMEASAAFTTAVAELSTSLRKACASMGTELGMSQSELSGNTKEVCDRVSARLRKDLQELRASAAVDIEVVAAPPRCEVDMKAYADCAARCDTSVEPAKVDLKCEGGEIVGTCSGACAGSCMTKASGSCGGTCEGSCRGACDGQCSMTDASGNCDGQCSGTCGGSCEGSCRVEGQASCQGECSGGCSVEYENPRCTGEVRPPKVSAECQASCDAEFSAKLDCQPGRAELRVSGDFDGKLRKKLDAVHGAIRAGFGQVLAINAQLMRVKKTGGRVIRTGRGAGKAAFKLGANAVSCASMAVASLVKASASATVSLEVSVSVSASVSS